MEGDLDIILLPYKSVNKIERYHILDNNKNILKFKICNIIAPFGQEINNNQYRLNICYSNIDINNKIKSYINFIDNIKVYEDYFIEKINLYKDYFKNDINNYKFNSNIINRNKYGIVIRCHLQTYKNKIITPFKKMNNNIIEDVSWLDFDKSRNFNMEYTFDSLWINHENKTYGISIKILSVLQIQIEST